MTRKRLNSHNLAALDVTRLLRGRTGREYVTLTGRGAAGIWAALRAMGFRERMILLPANTCTIVLWAVLKSGNLPLLVDIDPDSGNITPETIEAAQVSNPAAIIPCHMYGLTAPMSAITAWGQENNVFVIEDAALALGATVTGRPAGAWSEASIFSFGQGKIADHDIGGAFLTDDGALAKEVEKLLLTTPEWDDNLRMLTHQWHGLYWSLHQYESQNLRLLELYPRLFEIYSSLTVYRLPPTYWYGLPETLADLATNLAHRARLAKVYDDFIKTGEYPSLSSLTRPSGSILWRYPLVVEPQWRDDLLDYLWKQGIHDATRWYPTLRYMASALAPNVLQPATPQTDQLSASIINLRLDPGVDEAYVEGVIGIVRQFFAESDAIRD